MTITVGDEDDDDTKIEATSSNSDLDRVTIRTTSASIKTVSGVVESPPGITTGGSTIVDGNPIPGTVTVHESPTAYVPVASGGQQTSNVTPLFVQVP